LGRLAVGAGIGLIAAVIAGIEVPRGLLIVIPLLTLVWAVYHWSVVRPVLYELPRPDASGDPEEI
jgi:hypothetical protein